VSSRIDLIWQGRVGAPPAWSAGRVHVVGAEPAELARAVSEILRHIEIFQHRGDVWHAGLRLGLGGLPRLIDYVRPTWMFHRDPDSDVEATSFRLSLRACLMKTDVLRRVGFINPEFQSCVGAGLELGLRYLMSGVVMRHVPSLVPAGSVAEEAAIPLEDELRFVFQRFGRCVLASRAIQQRVLRSYLRVTREERVSAAHYEPASNTPASAATMPDDRSVTVSIIIPTIDRYPYINTLLDQLRRQTVAPLEIIVVDQTPEARRDHTLGARFADLPLRVVYADAPGQCSSRNTAIRLARGEYLLFLDDDDEIEPDLIELHLSRLHESGADVSAGVADEDGAGPLPAAFRHRRASDVFPTNNSMVRRAMLTRSGLFDLAYERGQRADGDLGMRMYLKGALMVLNPGIKVLHHHAQRGGLRVHRARVVTYASSRERLMHRHLPSVTEIYLARRYFSPEQVRERLLLRTCGTFSVRGSRLKKVLKFIVSTLYLPATLWQVQCRYRRASQMLAHYPQIPILKATAMPLGRSPLTCEEPTRVCEGI
jgi:GT2 family glycosyltransferase